MLAPDFTWIQYPEAQGSDSPTWLMVGPKAVAVVDRDIHGRWFTTVNRHRPPSRWLRATCANQAQGIRWVERWASRQASRLRDEPDYAARPWLYNVSDADD